MDLFAWGSFGSSSGPWLWALPALGCGAVAALCLLLTVPLGMWATGGFLLLWLLLAALGVWRRGLGPTAAVCGWPLLGLAMISVPMTEVDYAFRTITDHAEESKPQGVPLGEAWALAHLHQAGAAGLWLLGMPEAASAAWQRHVPGPAVRTISDDVAMLDPEVRRAVRLMFAEARQADYLAPRTVPWHAWLDERRSLRAALALDCPARVEGGVVRGAGGLTLRLRLRCPPREGDMGWTWGRVGRQELKWDPTLLGILEARGDMHRYEAVWVWDVAENDPRLQDTDSVPRGPGESLLLALGAWLREG